MSRIPEETITKNMYLIEWSVIKKVLGLKGDFKDFGLWSGLSSNQEDKGISKDTDTYFFETEIIKQKKEE